MTAEITTPRSRRAILAAALGAGVATVAAVIARPLAVRATDGDTVHVGHTYSASVTTEFDAEAGVAGFQGTSVSGSGLSGSSHSGTGVYGASGSGTGVYGFSSAASQPALIGLSAGAGTAARGVIGQSHPGYGVSGVTTTGRGVNGTATTGYGVFGTSTSGIANRGHTKLGTAGYFSTSDAKVGTALRAIGKVVLDNCAGIATIASGDDHVVVTPGGDLLATSAVVATLQGTPISGVVVASVVVDAKPDTFTIYLTASTPAAVTVAWHVFG
jgi:hypothetical protein